MRFFRLSIIVCLLIGCMPLQAKKQREKGETLRFFFRANEWVDDFLLRGVDTNYIGLPEHSWNLALTCTTNGNVSDLDTRYPGIGTVTFHTRTTPSAELGFSVGLKGFGFGYSWDLLHAYASNLNFSFGSKSIGFEFRRQRSTNLAGHVLFDHKNFLDLKVNKGDMWITNTSLSIWYALNSKHYSHNAAVKQSYIQKKSAGSLLLHLSYNATDMHIRDNELYSAALDTTYTLSMLTNNVNRMTTHQVSVGLGYGINYTPNKGKVLFHLSAAAMLVCYSINHVGHLAPDTVYLPGDPMYKVKADYPVHVSGTMRAAISWEINKWMYASVWAQAYNMHFSSHKGELSSLCINNWNWTARVTLGVRFGAGKERVHKVLYGDNPKPQPETKDVQHKSKIPNWIAHYFFSPAF